MVVNIMTALTEHDVADRRSVTCSPVISKNRTTACPITRPFHAICGQCSTKIIILSHLERWEKFYIPIRDARYDSRNCALRWGKWQSYLPICLWYFFCAYLLTTATIITHMLAYIKACLFMRNSLKCVQLGQCCVCHNTVEWMIWNSCHLLFII